MVPIVLPDPLKKQALSFSREYAKKTQVCQSARFGSLRHRQEAGESAHRGYGHDGQSEYKESDHFYVHPVNLHDVSSRCQNDHGVFDFSLYFLVTKGARMVQKAMTMALFLYIRLPASSRHVQVLPFYPISTPLLGPPVYKLPTRL